MLDTFESLLEKLSRSGVEYLVAGGVAVCLNGYVRTTSDLDILVEDSPENLERLLACLANFGEGHTSELTPADFTPEEGAVRIEEDFTLDVFTRIRGHRFIEFATTARVTEVNSVPVRFLAPNALIELKQDSFRDKDRIDVAALRQIAASLTPTTVLNWGEIFDPVTDG